MADLEIRISAKDMGAGAGLKALQDSASKAEGSLDRLGSSADNASRKIGDGGRSSGEAAGGLDRVGESADATEGKFTGLASGIDGVTSLMDDPSPQEFAQGLADIADGVGNFLIPTLKMMSVELVKNAASFVANAASSVAAAASSAAAHAAAAATMVAGWVAAGAAAIVNAALIVAGWIAAAAQAAISAAAMAISWMIAMGPALIIIALVIGAIALLIIHWDTIKEVAIKVWNMIWEAMKKVWNWISENWPLLLAILTGPFGVAVLLIVRNWDTIKEKVGMVLTWIKDRVTDAKNWLVDRFNDVVSFITGLPGKISSAASGMFDGIKDAFRSALNWLIRKWNDLSFTLPSVEAFGQKIGGQTLNTPNLPTFHGGGTFRAPAGRREGLAMLSDGERVLTPGQAGGGAPIIIYVEGSIRSDRDLVKMLTKEIDGGGIPGLSRSTA